MEISMRLSSRILASLLAICLIASATSARGDDEKQKDDAKPAEKTAVTEMTTQGAVDVGGQHILYNAIAGTITVGGTDLQDAQLGLDGKPEPGSQLALNEPKEPKDAPPTARMSYFAYFK